MKKWMLCLLIVALIAASLFTLCEFGSPNPVSTAIGLFRVCVLDQPYAQTGFLTKAYVGNPDNGFSLFLHVMEDLGYTHHPEEQMGSDHWFTDPDGQWTCVRFYINAYYSKWIWS